MRSVTQREIAAIFGVSQAAVSMALRRTGEIAPKLEEAICEAARQHGYSAEAQFHARALRQNRDGETALTNVICTLLPMATGVLRDSLFHVRFVTGVERAVRNSGDEMLLMTSWAGDWQFPRVVVRRQVDGLIWMVSDQDAEHFRTPISVPGVTLFFAVSGMDVVTVDNHAAMQAMGEYLARKGHRRVAFLGPESELARARLGGLRAGLAGTGGSVRDEDVRMERYVMQPDLVLPLVRALMDRRGTLPEPERFTAIAAYNDYIAWTLMRCLRDEYGLRIPQDMSVTGFDGLDSNDGAAPRLTTAAMPLEELGAEAVRMIDWRVRNPGEEHRRVVLHAPLVEGESVGAVSNQ
jgi:DNA-binding LacI/PurR family transcriptional regulator